MKVFLKSIILCLAFGPISTIEAQIGDYLDTSITPIKSFHDALVYHPVNGLKIIHEMDGFESGIVYFRNGKVSNGAIKIRSKQITIQESAKKKERPRLVDIAGIKIGLDSFFIVRNFQVQFPTGPNFRDQPELAQYLFEVGNYEFAVHHELTKSYHFETYMVREKGTSKWVSLPRKGKSFKKVATEYFSDQPLVMNKILAGTWHGDHALSVIKAYEYCHKYALNDSLFFNRYWREISGTQKHLYQAQVKYISDSTFTLDYFEGQGRIHQAHYSSLYPNKKDGIFTSYNDNGTTKREILYDGNEIAQITYFNEQGIRTSIQEPQEYQDLQGNRNYNWMLKSTFDQYGKELTVDTKITIERPDPIGGGVVYNHYRNRKLANSYRIINDKKTFRNINPDYDFKLKAFQKLLNKVTDEFDFKNLVSENVQGTIFLLINIDEKGVLTNVRRLNSLHADLDLLISQFISRVENEFPQKVKFFPYRVGSEKGGFEFVIPIEFGIRRFYRKTNHLDHFWYWDNYQDISIPINAPNANFPDPKF